MHALPGGHLEQVEDHLALAQAVEEDRDGAEVERARAEPDQVRGDAVELEVDHPQVLRARGHLGLEQRLDRAHIGHRVEVVGEVVHALDDRDHLPVGLVLGRLLDAGVHVADHRFDVAHDLALQRHEQPQHAVRRRVVRAEVERQQLGRGLDARHVERLLELRERHALLAPAVVGDAWTVAHSRASSHLRSSRVKITGSPPIGKSRRCGWPS